MFICISLYHNTIHTVEPFTGGGSILDLQGVHHFGVQPGSRQIENGRCSGVRRRESTFVFVDLFEVERRCRRIIVAISMRRVPQERYVF